MLHLMRLELIKTKMGRPVRQALITNVILLALTTIMCFVSVYGKDTDNMMTKFEEAIVMTSVLVRAAFLIFSSVVMNRLTVAEYRERTVLQLFTYPIQRKKLFAAKLMIVFSFTTIISAVCCVADNVFLYIVCKSWNLFSDTSISMFMKYLPDCLIGALMCGFISLIPFYFGMRKKSAAATIISSVIITTILTNSLGTISASNYMLRLLVAGGISVLVAVYTVCVKLNQLENIDL